MDKPLDGWPTEDLRVTVERILMSNVAPHDGQYISHYIYRLENGVKAGAISVAALEEQVRRLQEECDRIAGREARIDALRHDAERELAQAREDAASASVLVLPDEAVKRFPGYITIPRALLAEAYRGLKRHYEMPEVRAEIDRLLAAAPASGPRDFIDIVHDCAGDPDKICEQLAAQAAQKRREDE